MTKSIDISENLYQRLSLHVNGFETPENVIERLLAFFEENHEIGEDDPKKKEIIGELPFSLDIVYYPVDEKSFKQQLLQKKVAYILLRKSDGTKVIKEWNAINFTDNSSVNGNLRSGYLRDWKKKGIISAEISTDRSDLS